MTLSTLTLGTQTLTPFTNGASLINGDDGLAILQAMQGFRYGLMCKALGITADATWAQMQRALRIRGYEDLVSRLQTLPRTPDGKSSVVRTFSDGDYLAHQPNTQNSTVVNDLKALPELGLTLPMQKWLYVYETDKAEYDSDKAAASVLKSLGEIAEIEKDYPFYKSVDNVDYYVKKTGTGKDEKTSYIAIFRYEGAYCATDSAIETLSLGLRDEIAKATNELSEQNERLDSSLSRVLFLDAFQDQPLMKLARDAQMGHEERHVDAFLAQLQGLPPDASVI